jgi:Fe-S-cluster formation regulator IscX/YfhJ
VTVLRRPHARGACVERVSAPAGRRYHPLDPYAMTPILQHILRRKRDYARRPFFEFLRDDTRSVAERLAFYPCMAPFIMSFGDLNRYVLRVEPSDDPHQRMINAHTYEDDHHWPWYLEDFQRLGHDLPARPVDTLRALWSESCATNRLLSHQLAHLIWGAEPAVRLAVVEAIEETGNVLFSLTTQLAVQWQRETGTELRYLGEFHFALESGHAMNNEHAELARITLDEAQRTDARQRVDAVFTHFEAWIDELLAYALAAQPQAASAAPAVNRQALVS